MKSGAANVCVGRCEHQQALHRQGGRPAKQRRRERREAGRKVTRAAAVIERQEILDVVGEEPTKKPDKMTEQVSTIINYEKAE